MKRRRYIFLFLISFILYANTLFHDYALDDALVIIENEYTISGFEGIDDLFSEEFFSGFFDQKDKKLVAGGRYRPLSMVSFAIEWQLVMGSPFDGIDKTKLQSKMNQNANPKFILPYQRLLKDLSKTIHIENRRDRLNLQKSILERAKIFSANDENKILSNLEEMHSKRKLLLFISHLINVLLYSLTVVILFQLLEILLSKFKSDKWYLSIPFIASLFFLAHPIHSEVVANIKGRDEIMSLLGALITALIIVKYIKSSKFYLLIISFFAFLFALFSKEGAITFLVIVTLSIYFFVAVDKKTKYILISMLPLILGSIMYFYVRGRVIGGLSFEPSQELMNNSFLGMTFSEKFATIFHTLLLYIKLLIFPHPLTYDYYPYHIPVMSWADIWPVVSFTIYLAIGIYALLGLKKKSIISFGILFFLIALSPMSNIFFPIGVFMNERFVYAASIGFVIILAFIIAEKLTSWVKGDRAVIVALSVILALYSIKTVSRNRAWKNDFTLFTTDVETSKNSAKSNTSAGGKLTEEALKIENKDVKDEYLDRAIVYLKRAVKIHPEYNDAYLLLGNAQWERYHSLDSVYRYYNQILKRLPRYETVYSNIFESKINLVFDKPEKADQNIEILHQLEEYNPNNFYINYYLGKIYGRYKNNLEVSVHYLEKAAALNPDNVSVYKDLCVAYGISGDFKGSANALSRAVELDPKDPILKINLAMTYLNLRQTDKALAVMDATLQMNFKKSNADALVNLGYLYRNLRQDKTALECFNKARELNPDLFNK